MKVIICRDTNNISSTGAWDTLEWPDENLIVSQTAMGDFADMVIRSMQLLKSQLELEAKFKLAKQADRLILEGHLNAK